MNRNSFSIIIIPDTQSVTRNHPHLLEPMAGWIVDHAQELNVKIVLQLGDIVDSGANDEEQFVAAFDTMDRLREANIPFVICPGNHDYDNLLSEDRSLTMYNRYFGPQLYRNQQWFGGLYKEDSAENMFVKLDAEGRKLLVLALEFGPRDEVLAWADGVLEAHQDHEAIVITHCYMNIRGERTKADDNLNPKNYPGSFDANDGEDVWQKSLRKHPNVIAVFSGHHVPGNVSYRVDLGDNGNPVFQSFQNWQMTHCGGEGRFRIMRFLADKDELEFSVVHPQTGAYEEVSGYRVSLPFQRQRLEIPEASVEWSTFCYPSQISKAVKEH
ncbi:metallophosphoesterase [Paenibacillus solisilvae]|uniref:Metallophosphoesterase n=1 Tax=Paenibacillus solisilvae TaxID=2486751 RepID=A0ABW0VRM1_9BACL